VLREIGAKVGFVIEEKRTVDTVINLSIQEATIEEVLARLLTGQSYALVSQDDRGAAAGARISKIFLLGPGNPVVAAPMPRSTERGNSPATVSGPSPLEIARIYPAPTNLPTTGVTETRSSQREPQPTVDDLLLSHAIAGLGESAFDTQNLAMNVPQPLHAGSQTAVPIAPVTAADISDSLAKTTLLAQQNLQALVQGLATATESLMRSSAPVSRR